MKIKQFTLDIGFDPSWSKRDFFLSDSNAKAFHYIQEWPNWSSNGLIIYGPKGCGKTHLTKLWQEKSDAVVYDGTRQIAHTIIDDLSMIAETDLFHLFNDLASAGKHILLTLTQPVAIYPFELPDLKSRLQLFPAIEVMPPDDTILSAILLKQMADRQMTMAPDVVDYILTRVERSYAAIRDVIDKIDKLSLSHKRPITIPLVREIFE